MTEIDKLKVGAAFDRAAAGYDAIARFQHDVCARLSTYLPTGFAPARILDGGCGTGYGAQLLQQRWPDAAITGCDLSPEMVRQTQARGIAAICGDLEQLPFANASFELAWSSLALQWCQPARAFAELRRVLAPGGTLAFTSLASGTLHEIETAFAGIDQHRRVLPFTTAAATESALAAAGFTHIRVVQERWITRHADFHALLATIRGIGAGHTGSDRRRSMMGKAAWQTAQARIEAMRGADGLLPTTYEVLFALAEKK
ncbi:MAG: putative biotin synthesis protein BioC [Burkholderiaceae bacterium]|nr:putative biotin synthesis protein BioC [Burkholderiaceae bacterium]